MEPVSALQGSERCYLTGCRGNVRNISCLLSKVERFAQVHIRGRKSTYWGEKKCSNIDNARSEESAAVSVF